MLPVAGVPRVLLLRVDGVLLLKKQIQLLLPVAGVLKLPLRHLLLKAAGRALLAVVVAGKASVTSISHSTPEFLHLSQGINNTSGNLELIILGAVSS